MPELPDLKVYLDALRTLKRALTDPHLLAGIGNSYFDEILHRAKLSPFQLTRNLTPEDTETLFRASREVLTEWTDRLRAETGDAFPEKVTAFHPDRALSQLLKGDWPKTLEELEARKRGAATGLPQ